MCWSPRWPTASRSAAGRSRGRRSSRCSSTRAPSATTRAPIPPPTPSWPTSSATSSPPPPAFGLALLVQPARGRLPDLQAAWARSRCRCAICPRPGFRARTAAGSASPIRSGGPVGLRGAQPLDRRFLCAVDIAEAMPLLARRAGRLPESDRRRPAASWGPVRHRPGLPPARPAVAHALRRRGAARQAGKYLGQRSLAGQHAGPRRALHRPAPAGPGRAADRAGPPGARPARRSSWSSTTPTSSAPPTGSSTWARAPGRGGRLLYAGPAGRAAEAADSLTAPSAARLRHRSAAAGRQGAERRGSGRSLRDRRSAMPGPTT